MKLRNITLIVGETYYAKIANNVIKVKLMKIYFDRIKNEIAPVIVSEFSKNKNSNSWKLYSDEIFYTREEAKKGGLK
jgi:hypothetical protein